MVKNQFHMKNIKNFILDSLRSATKDAYPDEIEFSMQFDIGIKGETPVLKIVSAETSAQIGVKFTWKNFKM